jgi:hypothetical protein
MFLPNFTNHLPPKIFMRQYFSSVDQFINLKENCIFCNSRLSPRLTNFFAKKQYLSTINAGLIGSKFIFNLKYNSISTQIDSRVTLDTFTNKVDFTFNSNTSVKSNVEIMEDIQIHVELHCRNKKCKTDYYLCSGPFTFDYEHTSFVKIRPFYLFMEGFAMDKMSIYNDFPSKATFVHKNISSTTYSTTDLKFPMVDFESLEKEKLFNRIRNLVIFS